jgi:hypothetical protein
LLISSSTVAQVIHSQLTLNLNTLGTEQGGLKIAIEDIDGKVDNLLVETRKKRDAEYLMRQGACPKCSVLSVR